MHHNASCSFMNILTKTIAHEHIAINIAIHGLLLFVLLDPVQVCRMRLLKACWQVRS
jgi:hypothetical protein